MKTYEIKKRIIPAKKAVLPIFRDVPEREEWYFINESGIEQIARTYQEACELVEKNKKYFQEKREVEKWIEERGEL